MQQLSWKLCRDFHDFEVIGGLNGPSLSAHDHPSILDLARCVDYQALNLEPRSRLGYRYLKVPRLLLRKAANPRIGGRQLLGVERLVR